MDLFPILDPHVLSMVKSEILNRFDKQDNGYDQSDKHLITDNDWLITRIVSKCGDLPRNQLITKGVRKVDIHLKLRSKYSMSSMVPTQIPRHFHEIGLFEVGRDRYGQLMVVINLRHWFNMPGFQEAQIEVVLVWTELFINYLKPYEQVELFMDSSLLSLKESRSKVGLKVSLKKTIRHKRVKNMSKF